MVVKRKRSTLDIILNEARDLFLTRGFTATSVDDICKRAKVTKGGFFHYFKSKESLAKKVLEKFCDDSHQEMCQAGCCPEVSDPLERLMVLLDEIPSLIYKGSGPQGCLIVTFIQELAGSHPEIQSMCVKGLNEWAALFKKDLKLSKEKYAPEADMDVQSLANYSVTVIKGAQVMAKASGNRKVLDESIKHLKEYLILTFKNKQNRRVL